MDFNSQKIIALTIGVLVLASAINYFAFAWNAPPSFFLPIDVSNNQQTKAGELTVAYLTTSEIDTTNNQVFLNTSGNEGDIYNIDSIKGYDDMHLWSESTGKATVYLDETEGIKFYTNSAERMVVGSDNNIYISDGSFENCFLRVNGSGKLECYIGSNPPDGKFRSTQAEIMRLYVANSTDDPPAENPVEDFRVVINEEAVVKIASSLLSVERITDGSCSIAVSPYLKSHFYIKESGSSAWDLKESLDLTIGCWTIHQFSPFGPDCKCGASSKLAIWYYHLKQGDEIKITTQVWENNNREGNYANLISEVSGYNLTFKRQIANYVFTDSGHNVLHYFDKNTTEKMNSSVEAYWIPTPASIAVTADDAPITIIRQIE